MKNQIKAQMKGKGKKNSVAQFYADWDKHIYAWTSNANMLNTFYKPVSKKDLKQLQAWYYYKITPIFEKQEVEGKEINVKIWEKSKLIAP